MIYGLIFGKNVDCITQAVVLPMLLTLSLLLLLLLAPGDAGQAAGACGRYFQHNLNITVTCDALSGFYRLQQGSLLQLNPGLDCSKPLAQGTQVCVQPVDGKSCILQETEFCPSNV